MGWDAHLTDDRGHNEGSWEYTWNVSDMLRAAATAAAVDMPDDKCFHFDAGFPAVLDGKSGAEGQALLVPLVQELKSNRARYEAMNPANGWGSYSGIVAVMEDMIASVPEWPCTWEVA